ncbi:MAG: MFS transporter [Planctomycetaceae bacterium]|nr:MFS transporter [Planctomycetaceae bacterium]
MSPTDLDQPEHDAAGSAATTKVRWVVFCLASATSFLLYLHRYSWNTIGPMLQNDLKLNNTQVGLLLSLFYYTYASGQIPAGVIIDRYGPTRFLATIIAAWSAALVAISQTTHMILLGAARLLFGATQAGCYPALTKVSQDWFPPNQRTLLQGLVATTFGRAGGAMSPIILMTVLMGSVGLGWQAAVAWLGLIGGLLCVLVMFLMSDSPQNDPRVNRRERLLIQPVATHTDAASRARFLPFGRAFRNSSLRWFLVQQYLDAGSDVVFVGLIGSYFLVAHQLDLKQTGWLASLPLWGGALGGIVGGWLNDRLIQQTGNRRWVRSGVGFVGKIIGCAMLVLTLMQTDGTKAALLLMVAKFFSDWSQPTTWGTCTDLGGRFSATVFSIINTAGTLGGVLMPVVFGVVLDWFTESAIVNGEEVKTTDWGPLFALLAGMYFVSGVCWLLVNCTQTITAEND